MGFKTNKYILQARAGDIVNKEIELSMEDFGLILDALYEQTMQQEDNKHYHKAMKKLIKKVSKVVK